MWSQKFGGKPDHVHGERPDMMFFCTLFVLFIQKMNVWYKNIKIGSNFDMKVKMMKNVWDKNGFKVKSLHRLRDQHSRLQSVIYRPVKVALWLLIKIHSNFERWLLLFAPTQENNWKTCISSTKYALSTTNKTYLWIFFYRFYCV